MERDKIIAQLTKLQDGIPQVIEKIRKSDSFTKQSMQELMLVLKNVTSRLGIEEFPLYSNNIIVLPGFETNIETSLEMLFNQYIQKPDVNELSQENSRKMKIQILRYLIHSVMSFNEVDSNSDVAELYVPIDDIILCDVVNQKILFRASLGERILFLNQQQIKPFEDLDGKKQIADVEGISVCYLYGQKSEAPDISAVIGINNKYRLLLNNRDCSLEEFENKGNYIKLCEITNKFILSVHNMLKSF